MKRHAMIDIESLGTNGGYILLSIGISVVDMSLVNGALETNEVMTTYIKLRTKEQEVRGYKSDKSTLLWWSQQSDEARFVLETQPDDAPVYAALRRMMIDLSEMGIDWYWSKGAMDYNMLSHLYDEYVVQEPWEHWQLRDMRGLLDQVPDAKKIEMPADMVGHNALDDARYQVMQLHCAVNTLHKINAGLMSAYIGEDEDE